MKKAFAFVLMMGLAHTALAEGVQVSKIGNGIKMVDAQIVGTGFEINGQVVVNDILLQIDKSTFGMVEGESDRLKPAANLVCQTLGRQLVTYGSEGVFRKRYALVKESGGVTIHDGVINYSVQKLTSVSCK